MYVKAADRRALERNEVIYVPVVETERAHLLPVLRKLVGFFNKEIIDPGGNSVDLRGHVSLVFRPAEMRIFARILLAAQFPTLRIFSK